VKGYLRTVAGIGTAVLAASASFAQVATTLKQAELAGLKPQTRAEVESRMKQGGQTIGEILTTILLNSIKAKSLFNVAPKNADDNRKLWPDIKLAVRGLMLAGGYSVCAAVGPVPMCDGCNRSSPNAV